jgi:phage-related protein
MSVQTLYQKATRAYLLTQHVSALHSCVKAISLMTASGSDNIASLRRMIYVLFVNIVTSLAESKDLPTVFRLLGLKGTSKDDLVRLVWEKVLEGYSQVAGNVNQSLITAYSWL